MEIKQLVSLVFQLSIVAAVFAYGLIANRNDVLHVLRRPRVLALSLLTMFVAMPAIALILQVHFGMPPGARVALLVLALSPVPRLLPRTELSSGSQVSYSYGLALCASALSIAIAPMIVGILDAVMGQSFAVQPGAVALFIMNTVLLPLGAGLLVHRAAPRVAAQIRVPLLRIANVALLMGAVLLFVKVLPSILDLVTAPSTLLAIAIFVLAGLVLGHTMGGPTQDSSIALAVSSANRHPGVAIGVASTIAIDESFGATIVLYVILAGLASRWYAGWQQRRVAPPPRGGPAEADF